MAVQMQTRRARTDSAERWDATLKRALSNGLEVFTVADTGERLVTSASQLDTLHRTDGRACTCAAGVAGDPVCQHRAVVRYVLGWLGDGPETPAPALAPVASANCPACCGGGVLFVRECAVAGWPMPECQLCKGSGLAPAPQPMPRPDEGAERIAA